MSANADIDRFWGTSILIAEIRKLAKEIDECFLPTIESHFLIDDIQAYKSSRIIDRYNQNLNESELRGNNERNRNWKISGKSASACFSEIMEWQRSAARITDTDDGGLYDEMIGDKRQKRKRIKKPNKSTDDPHWLDPSNQDEVEEEIRRQREKFYEDKGWMVKEKQSHKKYRKLWKMMIKKELGKAARQRIASRKERNVNLRKAARDCSRYCRQRAIASQKCARDALNRGRRLAREISMCWRQLEKEEKTSRKKADKILTEQKRKNLEMLDAKRQQRKLNYLITQTELYTHFMSRKMSREESEEVDEKAWEILGKIEEDSEDKNDLFSADKAMVNVKEAVNKQTQQIQSFMSNKDMVNEASGSIDGVPSLFQGELKSYQKKGVDWLLYLFEQGINGILADEMGLGKTIQTIAFLAILAEKYDLWGPFLIVAPASTVHNWTQEFERFLPAFRVVPYWGSVGERKILRRFWNSTLNSKQQLNGDTNNSILLSDSSFHVVVSSYQVVLQDSKMVGRVRWQYLVLDEAHAIKNTSSQRWNTLLSFECRNRLLLTGTPIQNTMQELWALLHFIMPTLFDSHEEFNDWFSRDIESQASAAAQGAGTSSKQTANLTTTKLNATQLSRLHLILQPFMLRRVKTEVEHELPDKIEKMLQCRLSSRQSVFYHRLKRRIRIDDLNIDSISRQQKSLLNLVMQLRKVCNHPDLVEPRIEVFSVSTRFLDPYFLWPRLLVPLSSVCKPRPSVINSFLISHPLLTHHFFLRESTVCSLSFLSLFDINSSDFYRLMMGIDTKRLLSSRYRHLEALAWRDLYGTTKIDKNKSLPTFYINAKYQSLEILRAHSHVELLYLSDCYAIYDWVISGNEYRKVLRSMPTHSVVMNTMLVVQPSIASPVRLGVSAPSQATLMFSSISHSILPYRWPVTVEPVSNETRISDSAKLSALDKLLTRLKRDGHRVLIYSQMTRMIDIIEDLMRLRCHTFIRLDGSSRLCDRRDMVAEFQSSRDLFAFLLSTRAGGLGINLTAADTVIFFDSDWNPTVDQQAMDRAHRLGQNKQVTVYRLVCRDTVEEKILFRAEEKRQMHRMVIAGADLSIDQMRPRDVASLLLEDDEMNIRLEQRRKQAAGNRGLVRNNQTVEADINCMQMLQTDQISNSPEEKGGVVTFTESALQKKRRMAWAGVTKGGGRPKKLKLLEPTINTSGVPIKRTPSTSSHISSISETVPDNKKK